MATLYEETQTIAGNNVQLYREVYPKNPKKGFQLKELYEMLDCTIVEVLYLGDGTILIFDEEGLFDSSKATNGWATNRAAQIGAYMDPIRGIVGKVLHCKTTEFK